MLKETAGLALTEKEGGGEGVKVGVDKKLAERLTVTEAEPEADPEEESA